MKILITGSNGFVGKNLIVELCNRGYKDLFFYDVDSDISSLDEYTSSCDFVFHLAGVNRPKDQSEFMQGNFGFTSTLLDLLKQHHNICPILVSSSIQAALNNPYGASKRAGEDLVFSYAKETGASAYVFRLPNVFGKWCRPNYNSAIATFCHNITRELPIQVNDPEVVLSLVYIDDVVEAFIDALAGKVNLQGNHCEVKTSYTIKLGEVVRLLNAFHDSRKNLSVPNVAEGLERKLYATYLSYLPENQFNYSLKMNVDTRGSFTEILRTQEHGQFSVNITKPGITKGNHWHHTKNEKFVVVQGKGLIQFRKIGTDEILNYHVSGESIEVVDIPPGYTHNISNEGEGDLVTFMWASEVFNPEKPDTIFEKV